MSLEKPLCITDRPADRGIARRTPIGTIGQAARIVAAQQLRAGFDEGGKRGGRILAADAERADARPAFDAGHHRADNANGGRRRADARSWAGAFGYQPYTAGQKHDCRQRRCAGADRALMPCGCVGAVQPDYIGRVCAPPEHKD